VGPREDASTPRRFVQLNAAFRKAATLNQQKRDALLKRVSGIGGTDRDP
jgi:hypothetical protein